jgi:long-chain fatty acid transport protein
VFEQTARGIGLGNAITAGVEDPSAVFINPAALSEIVGNQLTGGAQYFNMIGSVQNNGRRSKNIHDDAFIPSMFANFAIPETDLTLGLGTYVPFGLATSYEDSAFTRFAAIRSELRTLYVTPAVAWQPLPYLSLGGGVSFVHSSAVLSRAIYLGAVNIGEGRLRFTDTDDAFAFNVGMLLKPHEKVKFGISFRSQVNLDYDTANVKFSDAVITGGGTTQVHGKSSLPLPAVIASGVQWQMNPEWTAEVDYKFTRWSVFRDLKVRFASPLPALGGAVPITALQAPQNWKDTSSVRLGIAYKINPQIEVRGGVGFDQSPVPTKSLSPAIPGADIVGLNGGIGYKFGQFGVDFAYSALFYKTRRVANNVLEGTNVKAFAGGVLLPALVPPGLGGQDKYKNFINLLSLDASYRF